MSARAPATKVPAAGRGAASRGALGTRKVPRAVREAEMIAAATRLFAEREYGAVSMDEIAAEADVSKPMVYAYFESKQGLLHACIDHATKHLIAGIESATPASLPPDEQMWQGLLALFAFIEERPAEWALLSPHGPHAAGQLAVGAARSREAITRLLNRQLRDAAVAEGVDPGVAGDATEPMAHAFGAAVQAVAEWWLRDQREPAERQALRLMNFAWMGLENLLRGRLWLPPAPGAHHGPDVGAGAAEVSHALAARLHEDRHGLLQGIFERMAQTATPDRIGDLEAVVEWRVGGHTDGEGDRFQLHFGEGRCRAVPAGSRPADTVFSIEDADLLRLAEGSITGPQLFTLGKIKVEGDLLLAAKVPRLFGGTG